MPLFRKLGLLNLSGIYDLLMATFMYRFKNCDLPLIYKEMFILNNTIHGHTTRQADDIRVPNWNLETRRRAVGVQGALIWNRIPENIRNSCSLNVFKSVMKKHIIETYTEN